MVVSYVEFLHNQFKFCFILRLFINVYCLHMMVLNVDEKYINFFDNFKQFRLVQTLINEAVLCFFLLY